MITLTPEEQRKLDVLDARVIASVSRVLGTKDVSVRWITNVIDGTEQPVFQIPAHLIRTARAFGLTVEIKIA